MARLVDEVGPPAANRSHGGSWADICVDKTGRLAQIGKEVWDERYSWRAGGQKMPRRRRAGALGIVRDVLRHVGVGDIGSGGGAARSDCVCVSERLLAVSTWACF
jgi:hypothetical protein